MELKFYECKHCGNIITKVKDSKVPVMCCGQKMEEIVAGTVEASREKHIPEYSIDGNIVNVVVGSVIHPMQDVHYIEWICIKTTQGVQIKHLTPNDEPKASFALVNGEEFVEVYAYCNLHGLWKK